MANMKKKSDGSNTKPFNVKLMTPRELVGGKEPKNAKPAPKKPTAKPVDPAKKKLMPKTTTKPKERMTKQDAAMKKLLERKYGKIYG